MDTDVILFPCIICLESDKIQNLQRVRSGIDTLIATCESLSKDELAVKLKAIRELPQHNTYVHNVCRKRLLNEARDKDKEEKQSSCSKVPVKKRLSEVR